MLKRLVSSKELEWWKPSAGDSIEGKLLGVDSRDTMYGVMDYLIIMTDRELCLPITTTLKKIDFDQLIGSTIVIQYIGEEISKYGKKYKKYNVYSDIGL